MPRERPRGPRAHELVFRVLGLRRVPRALGRSRKATSSRGSGPSRRRHGLGPSGSSATTRWKRLTHRGGSSRQAATGCEIYDEGGPIEAAFFIATLVVVIILGTVS